MAELSQHTVTVLTLAATYALLAEGWSLIYSVTGVLNLAQGEFFMLGAVTAATVATSGHGLVAGAVAGVLVTLAIAVVMELTLLRPLGRRGRVFQEVIVTLAVAIACREAVLWWLGPDPVRVPAVLDGKPFEVLGARVTPQAGLYWLVTVLLLLGLRLVLSATSMGSQLRACAESQEGARVVGIRVERVRVLAMSVAAVFAAVAGVLAGNLAPTGYEGGTLIGVKGFVAATLGGLGSPLGAVLGAVALAAGEVYFGAYVDDAAADIVVYGVLLLVLLIRPQGLVGRPMRTV